MKPGPTASQPFTPALPYPVQGCVPAPLALLVSAGHPASFSRWSGGPTGDRPLARAPQVSYE